MIVKADLHVHSVFSDGKPTPSEIVAHALAKGLGAIAVTDHDTFEGGRRAANIARKIGDGLIVVPGAEVRTERGDVLVYCKEPFDFSKNLARLIDGAHKNGCLVVPAHPFDPLKLGVGKEVYSVAGWDAIEVWNASASKRANMMAVEAARALGLPGLANSDAHILEQIGTAYTLIEVQELSVEGVLEAIRRGRVRPHFGSHTLRSLVKWAGWSLERRLRAALGLERDWLEGSGSE